MAIGLLRRLSVRPRTEAGGAALGRSLTHFSLGVSALLFTAFPML